jgi:hypothetical protein
MHYFIFNKYFEKLGEIFEKFNYLKQERRSFD